MYMALSLLYLFSCSTFGKAINNTIFMMLNVAVLLGVLRAQTMHVGALALPSYFNYNYV